MKKATHPGRSCEKNRQRGISLLEAVLYLSVASSVIVLMANIIDTESKRQEDISMASMMNIMMDASRKYISSDYDAIRTDLLSAARTTGSATLSVEMQTLADDGYLPPVFAAEDTNLFGQKHVLLVRAVAVSDATVPQATMSEAQMDGNGDTLIDNHLVDRDNSNDEATIEAILVTTGGDPVPSTRGPQIAVRTRKPTAGFLSQPDLSQGSYGSFSFDISGFNAFPEYPDKGRFANIIALSRFGAIGGGDGSSGKQGVPDPLQRCADILDNVGQTPDGTLYQTCLASRDVYSDVVFNSFDSDGDGNPDSFPRIAGLDALDMAGSIDTDGDGNPDRFSSIEGVYDMDMGAPADTDGDSVPDRFSRITNLSRIACAGTTGTAIAGTLILDCQDIIANGDLVVGGDAMINGTQTADRFIASEMGGQDLSEGIYDALLLSSGDLMAKPTCPPTSADGAFQMDPRIYVTPASFSHPGGLPTVGVRAFAEDVDASTWRVRMFNFVDEDQCTSSMSSPLTTNTSDFRAENASACSSTDGLADVYEVSSSSGRVLAMTRCY